MVKIMQEVTHSNDIDHYSCTESLDKTAPLIIDDGYGLAVDSNLPAEHFETSV